MTKSQLRNVLEDIEIRQNMLNFQIRIQQDKIDDYENYLYEANRRKDIELRDALRKYLANLQNKKNKNLIAKQELRDLQNSLYI